MLLFFSVARSAQAGQAERASEAPVTTTAPVDGIDLSGEEKMPTDKLVDVSPQALRMSSPFNSSYWLSAA
ncbi:MAG: hypothetical protein KBC94_04445 [Pseudacidovorax sp.]|nr:hypothetical protein [Pseudacidovorax sp.]